MYPVKRIVSTIFVLADRHFLSIGSLSFSLKACREASIRARYVSRSSPSGTSVSGKPRSMCSRAAPGQATSDSVAPSRAKLQLNKVSNDPFSVLRGSYLKLRNGSNKENESGTLLSRCSKREDPASLSAIITALIGPVFGLFWAHILVRLDVNHTKLSRLIECQIIE